LDPRRLRRLATTHTNLFGRTLLLMAAYFLMVASASRLGEIALAANAIILHFWHLTAYSVDGVAFATETLVGNALGAGDAALAHRLARRSMVWGVVLALLYSATYLLATRPLAGLFTTDLAVIAAVEGVALLTVLAMPVNAVAFIYDGVFIGANDMPYLFRQMSVSFVLVFLPALGILVHLLDGGLAGLWLAMVLFMAARAVTLHWRYRQPAWMDGRQAEALRGG
ncbi:MAG: MATE family efflux transporter, partial [Candidatus Eiseniibacteriota bacterium]